jgi:DNA polymerase IV
MKEARDGLPNRGNRPIRVGYLALPQLSLQAALLRQPALRGKPVLIATAAEQRGIVLAASPECRAAGVWLGMPTRDARELASGAVCLAPTPTADDELFERVLDLLDRFGEVVEPDTHLGAWFMPTFTARVPQEERRLGATIVDSLAAILGLESTLGVATGKFLAKIAAERAEVGTPEVIPDEQSAAYLAPLPINTLPLTPRAIDRLKLLGITSVGDFAHLPAETLPRRFGREATLAHRLARGEDDSPLVPRARRETRALRRTFEPPIEDRAMLGAIARDLLDRLCARLQGERQTFRRLELTIGLEDGRPIERAADLRLPTNQPEGCAALLRSMVETLELTDAVAAVGLRLSALAPERPRQETLFGSHFDDLLAFGTNERREHLDKTLAEISRRYRGRIRRVVPGDDPLSLLDDRRLLLLPDDPGTGSLGAEPARRPRVVALFQRGKEIFLAEPGQARDRLIGLHARWEADDWWPDAVQRTYYRVRTASGRLLTLARDHRREQWLLFEDFE